MLGPKGSFPLAKFRRKKRLRLRLRLRSTVILGL
jgi:hypothetical protein